MLSLLELQHRKAELKKKAKSLIGGCVVYSPELVKIGEEIEKLDDMINSWGTVQNSVYRIC